MTPEQLEAVHRAALALGYTPPQQPERYSAGPPAGGNGYPASTLPGSQSELDRLRAERQTEQIRYARMQDEILRLQRETVRSECLTIVQGLVAEGKALDVGAEVEALIALPDTPSRQDRAEYIRRYYTDDASKQAPWIQGRTAHHGRQETTQQERDMAVSVSTQEGLSYDEALKKVRGQE